MSVSDFYVSLSSWLLCYLWILHILFSCLNHIIYFLLCLFSFHTIVYLLYKQPFKIQCYWTDALYCTQRELYFFFSLLKDVSVSFSFLFFTCFLLVSCQTHLWILLLQPFPHTHIFSSFKETVVASLKQPQNISLPLCLWQSILVYKSSFSKCWTTSFPKVVEATFTILKFMLYIPWKFLLTLILMGEKGFRISLHFIFKVVCLTFFLIGSLFFSFLTFVVPWHFLHYLFLCIFWVNYMVFLVF